MASDANNPGRAGLAGIREGIGVCLVALIFALAANALSSRGLSLTRNYFPRPPVTHPPKSGDSTSEITGDPTAARLAAQGLNVVTHTNAVRLFQDPARVQGGIVFLDARNETQYSAGHIPGAHLFDPYRAPQSLPAVLALCLSAEQIVIYCGGGECEDSEFAAILLRDAGVPAEKILVYPEGFQAWTGAGLPMETGRPDRNPPSP
ncbi:MAG: rhodanese-like domain-containing protein [Verrucomicrobia bacterium]|nr:rhodanese-like domain-containing protein [Verrucomicrobiota bacterium]